MCVCAISSSLDSSFPAPGTSSATCTHRTHIHTRYNERTHASQSQSERTTNEKNHYYFFSFDLWPEHIKKSYGTQITLADLRYWFYYQRTGSHLPACLLACLYAAVTCAAACREMVQRQIVGTNEHNAGAILDDGNASFFFPNRKPNKHSR